MNQQSYEHRLPNLAIGEIKKEQKPIVFCSKSP